MLAGCHARSPIDVRPHASPLRSRRVLPCIVCVLGTGQTQRPAATATSSSNGGNGPLQRQRRRWTRTGTRSSPTGPSPSRGRPRATPPRNCSPGLRSTGVAADRPTRWRTSIAMPPAMTSLTVEDRSVHPRAWASTAAVSTSRTRAVHTCSPGLYVISGPSGTEWDQNGNDSSVHRRAPASRSTSPAARPAAPVACAAGQTGGRPRRGRERQHRRSSRADDRSVAGRAPSPTTASNTGADAA